MSVGTCDVSLGELTAYLDKLLDVSLFRDSAHNGLQVEASTTVSQLCTAVDISLAAVEQAVRAGADALLVHHGLLWGQTAPLIGRLGGVVRALCQGGLSLLAYHLPLDAHPTLGNNACLADLLDLTGREPFGHYKGQVIGVAGALPSATDRDALRARLADQHGAAARLHAHGPEQQVRRIAVVSGCACDEALLSEVRAAGVDLLVTGEVLHESWHVARELGINLIAAGHYATETHGVRALGDALAKHYGVKVQFLDIPTGL